METKDWFLVINKDKGCTSHDCVKRIRQLLNTKKVGHTGTLDPEVIGTLPIAIGSATRFIQYLPQGKTYIGKIKLGIRTNTDDIHGEIINQKSWPKISDEKLDQYLNRFRGIIKQIPPKVSSVHVNGERAYKKSFRNEIFELAPREVKIDELILMKWDQINGIIEIKIKCSAGTYVRSIARDLGKMLWTYAYVSELRRVKIGKIEEKDIILLDKFEELVHIGDHFEVMHSIRDVLDDIPAVLIDQELSHKFRNGLSFEYFSKKSENDYLLIECTYKYLHPLYSQNNEINFLHL